MTICNKKDIQGVGIAVDQLVYHHEEQNRYLVLF